MMLPLHLLYQPGDLKLVTASSTYQYLEELYQHLRTTFAFAQNQLKRIAEGRKAYYDQKASHNELIVGDKVWYYSFAQPRQNAPHRLSKKCLPHWTGDYRQALTCCLSKQNQTKSDKSVATSMHGGVKTQNGDIRPKSNHAYRQPL